MPPSLWHWRSRDGWEIDLLIEHQGRLHPIEIKSTSTPRPGHASSVVRWRQLVGEAAGEGLLIANARRPSALRPGVRVLPWDAV